MRNKGRERMRKSFSLVCCDVCDYFQEEMGKKTGEGRG